MRCQRSVHKHVSVACRRRAAFAYCAVEKPCARCQKSLDFLNRRCVLALYNQTVDLQLRRFCVMLPASNSGIEFKMQPALKSLCDIKSRSGNKVCLRFFFLRNHTLTSAGLLSKELRPTVLRIHGCTISSPNARNRTKKECTEC